MFLITSASFAQEADVIVGKYHTPNNLDIKIYEYKGKYYGKIIALNGFNDGQTLDIYNPDESKHSDSLIGKNIISNLKFDKEEKEWVDGRMYGAHKGMYFDFKITEVRKDEIEVVGSKFVFWKTMLWKKI